MLLNLSQPIHRISGDIIPDLTLASMCFAAAAGVALEGDNKMNGEQKMRLFSIASKVHGGGMVELTAEEIALIKERIGRSFVVEAVGQAYLLLEGKPQFKAVTQAAFDEAVDARDMPTGAAPPTIEDAP